MKVCVIMLTWKSRTLQHSLDLECTAGCVPRQMVEGERGDCTGWGTAPGAAARHRPCIPKQDVMMKGVN